jgi:hypothetical protein
VHARTSPTPFTRLWSITDIITERARTWLCPTTIYYSIKREKREILEREERETYKREKREILEGEERETYRERRQAGTLAKREQRERRSARDRTGSLAFMLEIPYQLHHKNLVEAAVLVHVHALESARACSKLTQACPVHPKMPKEASLYKT